MKARSFLILSLGLNLCLAGALIYFISPSKSAAGASAKTAAPEAQPVKFPVAKQDSKSVAPSGVTKPASLFDWRMVESPDYRTYIANLRAIGCPEETIQDIIKADVNKLFDSRRREARGTNKFEFWKTGNPMAMFMNSETVRQQQELSQEKRSLLKELLGQDVTEKPDLAAMVNPFETILDFLPASKQSRLFELEQKYAARLMENVKDGVPDQEEIMKVQKDKEAELASLLSPEEKQQYDLRMSQTAMMMRMQLDGFDPSKKEFEEIFKVRKAFDDEYSTMFGGMNDPETTKKRQAAETAMNDQIKEILGDDRFTEYLRNLDPIYKGIAHVVDKQGLPKDTAERVYDMRRTVEEQVQRLNGDTTIPADERQQALQQIRQETEKALTDTLGQDGLESYRKQPTAFWLNRLPQ